MGTPRVSVVMPVYNGEKYLDEAIDSIRGQTFSDFEFIIIDDGSEDRTPEILQRHAHEDPRIRILRQPASYPKNYVPALNRGCAQGRGVYIARMDADDVSLPDRLDKQVAYLDAHAEVAVLGGAIQFMTESGLEVRCYQPPVESAEIAREGALAHPTVMMRRDAFEAVGGYRVAFMPAEDYDLWLRLGERCELANLEDILVRYRVHSNQVSTTHGCQQVLSALAAHFASQVRRTTGNDPSAKISVVSIESLMQMGVPSKDVEAVLMARPLHEANKLRLSLKIAEARSILVEIYRLLNAITSTRHARAEIAWTLSSTFSIKHDALSKARWMSRSCLHVPKRVRDAARTAISRYLGSHNP